MDIYYTIEEKYLQAVDELNYGESPKALQLLNEIVSNDPAYARAHYQLGLLYYYKIGEYQAAGYHFKLCAELEPSYPDVYFHYLKLIVFLNKGNLVNTVAQTALKTPGVNHASINYLLGLHAEKNSEWRNALNYYNIALANAVTKKEHEYIDEGIERTNAKRDKLERYKYQFSS